MVGNFYTTVNTKGLDMLVYFVDYITFSPSVHFPYEFFKIRKILGTSPPPTPPPPFRLRPWTWFQVTFALLYHKAIKLLFEYCLAQIVEYTCIHIDQTGYGCQLLTLQNIVTESYWWLKLHQFWNILQKQMWHYLYICAVEVAKLNRKWHQTYHRNRL